MRRARRALGMAGPAACALALAGCYGSPEPLGPAAQGTVDRALVGDWRCSSAGDGSETALVWIFPLDGTQYVVEWRTADETDHYRAHASRAGDETLLNVRELTSGRAGEEWYFLRYRIDEGRRLRLSLVDDEALGGLEGEAALDAIRRRAADPALYTDLAVCQAVDRPATSDDEAAAARAVFEKNLEAIARRDREAYLATYLDAPTLARTGFEGPLLGYEPFAKGAGSQWPDTFEARDVTVVPVRPGVVYGTYRYRVRYGAVEQAGISERVLVETPAGWRIAVTSAFEAPPRTAAPAQALVGATLLDGRGGPPVPDAVVIVRGGKIDCAGARAACPLPEGAALTDVKGSWITPGLVDAHVHFSQTGWADGRPDALDVRDQWPYEKTQAELEARPDRFFRSYLCSGVTAVFDVGGYAWTTRLWRRAQDDPRAPHVAAAGPLLSTIDHWLNLPAERQFMVLSDEHAAREGVRYLAALGARAVKVWYIVTPQRTVESAAAAVAAAGEEARKAGLPLIVHATGLAEAKAALRAGARLLVHGVSDAPVDEEFLSLARANGAVYCPTLTVLDGYVRLADAVAARRAPAVDDPHGCVDASTRARLQSTARVDPQKVDAARMEARRKRAAAGATVGRANLKRIQDAGIAVAMGTDAGNPLTLHGPSVYAEMEAMQAAGLTPLQVLVASTAGAARALGMEKEIGTLEKGKAADLLVVTADPAADIANLRRLRSVMRAGVLRSVEELAAAAR